jgi:gliding motility-associated-like protein
MINVFDTVIAVLSPDTALCPGECVNLTGTGGIFYSWSPSTGLNATNQSNVTACPNATQSYSFTTSVGSCSDTKIVTVEILPVPQLNIDDFLDICKGDSVLLQPSGCTNYSWSPPTGLSATNIANPFASPTSTTTYYVVATDSNSCPITLNDSIIVNVIINPYTVAPETTIILGTSVGIYANGGISYLWTPSASLNNNAIPDPIASPTLTTTYYVTITHDNGCTSIDSVIVYVDPNPIINFPNAFTPNKDGKNDNFRPRYKGLIDVDFFKVYNRWGQLLYETTNLDQGWDGTLNGVEQEVGTYVFILSGKSTVGANPILLQGNFTLMR